MASFRTFMQVSGRQYELSHFDIDLHQKTDTLGRPASPTIGGACTLTLEAPPANDATLYQWMVDPAQHRNAQVVIKDMTGTTLKVIKLYNTHCVGMSEHFSATGTSDQRHVGSLFLTLRLSPQAVRVGNTFHDNDWPGADPIVDWDWADMNRLVNARQGVSVARPGVYQPVCSQIGTATDMARPKRERYNARLAVIGAARQQPANADLQRATDRFELNNRAIERARLSDDIYVWGKYESRSAQLRTLRQQLANGQGNPAQLNQRITALEGQLQTLSQRVHPPEGWRVIEPFQRDPATGFAYAVYQSDFERPPRPVLVFRGTDNEDAAAIDWRTNGMQGMGMETAQYSQAIAKAQELYRRFDGEFDIAGHSKAGGQAAAASIVTGVKGYTFNAAGVHRNTVGRYGRTRADAARMVGGRPLVDAFHFPHDILSNIQDQPAWAKATGVTALAPLAGVGGGGFGGSVAGGRLSDATAPYLPAPTRGLNRFGNQAVGGAAGAVAGGVLGTLLAPILGAKVYFNEEMPPAVGVRHQLPAQDINGRPIASPGVTGITQRVDYHGMSYLINSMERQKHDDLQTMANGLGCA